MSRLPLMSAKDMAKILTCLGFIKVRQTGSHVLFKHPDGRTTVVPFHPGEDLGRGLIRKIMRDIELTPDEFTTLMKKIL